MFSLFAEFYPRALTRRLNRLFSLATEQLVDAYISNTYCKFDIVQTLVNVARIQQRFTGQWGDKTRAHFNAAWRTDLSDDANVATARFVDESVGFTIAGAQIDDSRAIFGVGVNHQLTKRLSLYVDYDGEFASDLNSHALRGGLRFGF